jgi:hypothetical protein
MVFMSGTQAQESNQVKLEDPVTVQNSVDPKTINAAAEIEVPEEFADPKKAYAEIKKLRDEAAKHRTKAKSLEDELGGMKGTLDKLKTVFGGNEEEQVDPAEALQAIQAQNELLLVELSINQIAREYGISSDQDDYFKFLLNKKFSEMSEGDEISEDDLHDVITNVKKIYGSGQPVKTSTGLNVNGNAPTPTNSTNSALTAEQFVKMSLAEKSKIYAENANLYSKLLNEAREQRLI